MLAIRLPEAIEKPLELLAQKTGRTKTFYARVAILEQLDEMEDTYIALNRLENPGKLWTQEDLEAEIDLES